MGLEALKIIKIRSLTPPIACESERGPALKQEQVFDSNEVRVSLLVNVDDDTARPWATIPTSIFARRADESEVPRETALPACHYESTTVRAREALALSFVDKDLAPRAIPERIIARKLCARADVHAPARSLTFGKLFPAAAVASKSRQPNSRGRPQNRGDRRFREPFRPEPVIAQGQGRVDCRGRVPREHSSPRRHPQGREDRDQVCPLSRCTPSRRPPFPVHSSGRDERKRRRELLCAGSSRAGRQELPILVDGAEVRT